MTASDRLGRYRAKRDFTKTPEPVGGAAPAAARRFVIQKHAARRLHYDLRLEMDGTFKSWAVPKGPSLDPADKRIAVQTEDHPLEYGSFEGVIPEKQYGAGTVIIWDRGTWTPINDPEQGYAKGDLKFRLDGEKLHGGWVLVRMKPQPGEAPLWLLIKERDEHVRAASQYDITEALPDSVVSGAEQGAAAPLPFTQAPQLASLVARPPASGEWAYENKFDGYRLLARVDGTTVRLFTRNGHDWTSRLPHLARAIQRLGLKSAWLDGEIVIVSEDGRTDFQALQNAFDNNVGLNAIQFYLFDLMYLNGRDLRNEPLKRRRARLEQVLAAAAAPLHFSASFGADGLRVLQAVAELGGEGVIGKRLDAPYVAGRSTSWIKLKKTQRQEFVVVGYTAPRGARSGFGALVLAVNDDQGRLVYVGSVGSGFGEASIQSIHPQLLRLKTAKAPVLAVPPEVKAQWVAPKLVAEVSYSDWTREGVLRHPVFRGLRDDKEPNRIVRETPVELQPSAPAVVRETSLKVTHGDRVIDPGSGITKLQLVQYYEAAAPYLLEHIKSRPVAVVRAPAGITGQVFFQKAPDTLKFPGLTPIETEPGETMISFSTAAAIVQAAQLNVVEFHPWGSTARALDKPDRVVFDLDPGERVGFDRVIEAAMLVQTMLDELGLTAFLKTTGGKGLHVVVPIAARQDWDTVREFADAVVAHLQRMFPTRFVSKLGAHNRVGRILIDVARNLRGATAAAAYSARVRPGLGVSVPIGWDELPVITSGAHWTIIDAAQHFERSAAAWRDLPACRPTLARPLRQLSAIARR